MNWNLLCIVLLLSTTFSSTIAIAIDDFHCKVPTCRDFHYHFRSHHQHKHFVNVCYQTVFELQTIPDKTGKCIKDNGEIHSDCIFAVAATIKKCIDNLKDVPVMEAKFFCGHTLMKYCAVHVGLDRFPMSWSSSG